MMGERRECIESGSRSTTHVITEKKRLELNAGGTRKEKLDRRGGGEGIRSWSKIHVDFTRSQER